MRLLHHQNIVRLHEVYEGKRYIYLVMDLMEGGDLFDRISATGLFTEREAQQIISQILLGLKYLHNRGLMHRDLKPENVIFHKFESNELRLADFGLSEFALKKNYLFKRCGTPGYVAPEILRNELYDEKSDIFSVGVILFILYTFHKPVFQVTRLSTTPATTEFSTKTRCASSISRRSTDGGTEYPMRALTFSIFSFLKIRNCECQRLKPWVHNGSPK